MYDSIPLCRSIFDHWVFQDAEYLKIWVTMLGRAKYTFGIEKKMYQGVIYEIDRGQFIFGRLKWVKDYGITESRLRTLLKKLTAEDMIEVVRQYPKFTIYSITNYEKFNRKTNHQNDQQETEEHQGSQGSDDQQTNQQNDQQVSSTYPADDQQMTTNEEVKEVKHVKEVRNINIVQIDSLWSMYPKKKGKADAFKKIPKLIKEFGYEKIERCIQRYVEEIKIKQTEEQYIKNGSTFFNNGYVDYLDDDYKKPNAKSSYGNGKSKKPSGWSLSEERHYDMNDLEKKLLGWPVEE